MVYADVFEAPGGIKGSKPISEEPHNKAQIYNTQNVGVKMFIAKMTFLISLSS